MKKETQQLKDEIKSEVLRKKHLGFHHSPNRYCGWCMKLGRKEALEDELKFLEDLKIIINPKKEIISELCCPACLLKKEMLNKINERITEINKRLNEL